MILSGIPKIPYPFSAVAKHPRRDGSPDRLSRSRLQILIGWSFRELAAMVGTNDQS